MVLRWLRQRRPPHLRQVLFHPQLPARVNAGTHTNAALTPTFIHQDATLPIALPPLPAPDATQCPSQSTSTHPQPPRPPRTPSHPRWNSASRTLCFRTLRGGRRMRGRGLMCVGGGWGRLQRRVHLQRHHQHQHHLVQLAEQLTGTCCAVWQIGGGRGTGVSWTGGCWIIRRTMMILHGERSRGVSYRLGSLTQAQ